MISAKTSDGFKTRLELFAFISVHSRLKSSRKSSPKWMIFTDSTAKNAKKRPVVDAVSALSRPAVDQSAPELKKFARQG